MRRSPLILVLAACVVAAAGCGGEDAALPPAKAAPTQSATVDWKEPTSETGPRLVFEVREVDILDDGWRARVAIRNDSGIPWAFGDDRDPAALSFGVMLFSTGDLEEVEQRNRDGDMPGLRRAHVVSPPPPAVLPSGGTWTGTISAPGSLAAGRWLRVVFGPLYAQGKVPDGLHESLVWISDNAHLLKGPS